MPFSSSGVKVKVRLDMKRLQELTRDMPEIGDNAVRHIAAEAQRLVKAAVPVKSGELKRSIRLVKGRKGSWIIRDGTLYGVWIEFGRAHGAARPFFFGNVYKATREFGPVFQRLIARKRGGKR